MQKNLRGWKLLILRFIAVRRLKVLGSAFGWVHGLEGVCVCACLHVHHVNVNVFEGAQKAMTDLPLPWQFVGSCAEPRPTEVVGGSNILGPCFSFQNQVGTLPGFGL